MTITKQKHTHRYRNQLVAAGGEREGEGRGKAEVSNQEMRTSVYKINKYENILYTTGNIASIL